MKTLEKVVKEMTVEDNKLIAEFMGFEKVETWYEDTKKSLPKKLRNNDNDQWWGFDLDEILFDESWDWLMPVVLKCISTGDDTDAWDDVLNALQSVEINETFDAVVSFIKRYNNAPSKEEIQQEMELHNADEVGIDNQWSFDDAEYHLLLSDKYNN